MCCHDHLYPVWPQGAYWILFWNIISPGAGTCYQAYYWPRGVNNECNYGTYCVGIAQAMTAFLLVGWIWSIWHGYEVYKMSQEGFLPTNGGEKVIIVQNQNY